MNALNDLTTGIRFRERMRGYDYDQVDNYVKAVAQAAVQAQGHVAQLEERLRQLENGQPGEDDDHADRETLVRTLVLAQRTADAAVAEAQAEAKATTDAAEERAANTVSEAEAAAEALMRSSEERAAQMQAESEENCQLIIAETKRTAAIEIAAERENWLEELRGLQEAKADLEATSARIRARLEDERTQMRQLMAAFCAFVEEIAPGLAQDHSESPAEVADGGREEASAESVPLRTAPEPPESELLATVDGTSNGASAPVAADPDEDTPYPNLDHTHDDAPYPNHDHTHDDAPQLESGAEGIDEGGFADSVEAAQPDPQPAAEPVLEPVAGAAGHETFLGETVVAPDDHAVSDPVPEVPMVRWLEEPGSSEQAEDRLPVEVPSPVGAAAGAPSESRTLDGLQPQSAAHQGPAQPGDAAHYGEGSVSAVTQAWPVVADEVPELEAPELFDSDVGEDDEFIEQLRRVVTSDAPLPDSEAAMSAFFDHDDSTVPSGGRGRSGSLRHTADPAADRFGPRRLRALSGLNAQLWP